MAWIPIGITNQIKCICRQFLWRNQGKASTFAWIAWDRINFPKQWGGWGLKDLHLFSRALAAKMGWHIITGQSLWKEVMVAKYISPQSPLEWIRGCITLNSGASIIWRAITRAAHILQNGLSWQIGLGTEVRIGTHS